MLQYGNEKTPNDLTQAYNRATVQDKTSAVRATYCEDNDNDLPPPYEAQFPPRRSHAQPALLVDHTTPRQAPSSSDSTLPCVIPRKPYQRSPRTKKRLNPCFRDGKGPQWSLRQPVQSNLPTFARSPQHLTVGLPGLH